MHEGVVPILSTSAVPGELPGGVTQTLTLKAAEALTITALPGLACCTGPHTIKLDPVVPVGTKHIPPGLHPAVASLSPLVDRLALPAGLLAQEAVT